VVKNLVQFEVSVKSDYDDNLYTGIFKAKTKLSIREKLMQDTIYRGFLGNNPQDASQDAKSQAFALAYCRVRLLDPFPKFWTDSEFGEKLEDTDILYEICNKCNEAVEKEFAVLKKAAEEAEAELKKE